MNGALAAAVERFERSAGRDGARKLLIERDGERLFAGPDIDAPQGVWSITKTFLGLTLGLLVDDGRVSLDARAAEILPELADAFPNATIRHFASMTSGYRAAGDETPIKGYAHGPSRTPFLPAAKAQFAPGTAYSYWDSAPNMLALALTIVAGEPLVDLFRRRIGDPLGMEIAWGAWLWRGLLVNGGAGNHFGPVQTTAPSLARLGRMMLDGGAWEGARLLSPTFCAQALTPVVGASVPLHVAEFDGRNRYGLFWWLNGADAQGALKWPGIEPGAYAASGYNNNDLFVLPRARLVVVRLGMDQDHDGAISDAAYAALLRDAIAAVSRP